MTRILKGERVIPGELFDARAEAPRIREDARREGFEAGRQEGLAQVTALVTAALEARARQAEVAEPELLRLAVSIAGKLLGRELTMAPEAVVDVVRGALAEARTRRQLVVRVHPEDVPLVEAARASLVDGQQGPSTFAVTADEGVTRGGCRIETEVGVVDARLDVQLAAIERALLAARSEA